MKSRSGFTRPLLGLIEAYVLRAPICLESTPRQNLPGITKIVSDG
jgi:hypothetical protein